MDKTETSPRIVMKASMFKHGHPRVAVTKSWVTNNHWVIHKSLLKDPLPWLSIATANDWLNQYLKKIDHIELDNAVTDKLIDDAIAKWLCNGGIQESTKPWEGVWKNEIGQHVTVYPHVIKDVYLCIHSRYYKMFQPWLTHMLISGPDKEEKNPTSSLVERTSLCNSDASFILRPFRESTKAQLEFVK